MISINNISKAIAYFETSIRKIESDRDEVNYSPNTRMERNRQKKHYATAMEVMRIFLANPDTAITMCKGSASNFQQYFNSEEVKLNV